MGDYKEPDLELVLELDFRFCVSRRHLVDVLLPNHEPPLKLVETLGAGTNNVNIFSVIESSTSAPWNLNSVLLSCTAEQVAAENIAGLGNSKLPGQVGHMSDTEWSLAVIQNPARLNIGSIFSGSTKCPVGTDDGMTAK